MLFHKRELGMRSGDQLAGRVALISGGGGEIAGAIARQFVLQGAAVFLADDRPEAAEATAQALRDLGGQAEAGICDVSKPQDVEAAVHAAVAAFGKLTTLVNTAAATTPDGTCETLPFEEWNKALAVNLSGAFLMCKYAVPEIRKAGGGSIINIASQLGQVGVPGRAPYSSTKAALIQLTQCQAGDHAADGIRVNSLSPGVVSTSRSQRRFGSAEAQNRLRGPWHLLNRCASVDEIASAALFLASDDSSFVTGTDLLVDGGYLAFKGSIGGANC
jgi:NAD(P)-dependent dehydrogenase (short-subunit alcohol dehydrogenase family)